MINYKFRAIKDRNFPSSDEPCFRKGEVYVVEDGKITFASGWTTRVDITFEEFIERNKGYAEYIKLIRDIDTTKKYKGYEIVQMLHEHTLKEGDKVTLINGIYKKELGISQCCYTLSLRDDEDVEIANSFLTSPDNEFTIILYVPKVDFLTAWKAYLEGKKIKSCEGYSYQNGEVFYEDDCVGDISFDKEELEGEWVIIDDSEAL